MTEILRYKSFSEVHGVREDRAHRYPRQQRSNLTLAKNGFGEMHMSITVMVFSCAAYVLAYDSAVNDGASRAQHVPPK